MKSRLYYLFIFTTVIRIIGDAIEGVALPWHLLNETSSLLSVAGYSLASMLPWVIAPPLMGRFLDKTEKKVRLAFLALLIQSFFALTIIKFASNIWAFYILISLISALDVLHRYFGFMLIASMTLEESELQKLNAKVQTVGEVTSLLMFPVVGYLAYLFGIKLMLLDALFLLIGALLLIPYVNVPVRREETIGEGSKSTQPKISHRIVFVGIVLVLVFNFAVAPARIFVFNALKNFNKGEFVYGLLNSVGTLGSLAGAAGITIFAYKHKIGISKPLLIGMLLESLAVLLLGLPSLVLLFVGMLLLNLGRQILNISFDSLFQRIIPLEKLGTYKGIFDSLATLIIPLSQLTFAWLIEHEIGVLALAAGVFGLGVLSTMGFFILIYSTKKMGFTKEKA
ncbi:MFS transporter [Thermococcus argininiproducens]|uniref:MFS transporter n=1 Tax=Thermococcus argininiproducens TaxID=2866384 RepID=A0A9E7SC66_9EURY|nr:MFS transporter [Thermococcus argininiproducens]USG99544.1 MFS transporter [Thermococcus argininiproducens]